MAKDVTFKSSKAAVMRQHEKNIGKCLTALGMEYTANAQAEMDILIYNTPQRGSYVRTGNMRARQTYQVDAQNREVIVGNTQQDPAYPLYVTMGTRHMEARPFMQNAVNGGYSDDYRAIAQSIMGEGFD